MLTERSWRPLEAYKEELYHHGILGQRWGQKNGPPYPLKVSDHSVAEKKAGWKKSLSKSEESVKTKKEKRKLTDEEKKRITKIALSALAAAAVVGGTIYLVKTGKLDKLIDAGKGYIDEQFGGSVNSSGPKIGKALSDIDSKMVNNINKLNRGTIGGQMNCFHTSTSYILNSVFGKNTSALPFNGTDELSGLAKEGRHYQLYNAIFNNIHIRECYKNESMYDMFKSLKNGSTGVLHIGVGSSPHFVNYEKDLGGNVTIIDPQLKKNQIRSMYDYVGSGYYRPYRILDFSDATIKENAGEILKYIVGGYND